MGVFRALKMVFSVDTVGFVSFAAKFFREGCVVDGKNRWILFRWFCDVTAEEI